MEAIEQANEKTAALDTKKDADTDLVTSFPTEVDRISEDASQATTMPLIHSNAQSFYDSDTSTDELSLDIVPPTKRSKPSLLQLRDKSVGNFEGQKLQSMPFS